MHRIKILIEYEGTNYVGWQRQKNGISIQHEIEKSLKKIFNEDIKLFVAGRTDAGVHAFCQVAHFDIQYLEIDVKKIYKALNFYLKKKKSKITILDSIKVDDKFHARFSAKKKIYLYKILNRNTKSFILENKVWFVPFKINVDKMISASKHFYGKHDFHAFRSVDCQAKNSIRTINKININKINNVIEIRIEAPSFMHNQVRIMVGTLINVGKDILKDSDILDIIRSRKRENAGPTAPSKGLYLEKVVY